MEDKKGFVNFFRPKVETEPATGPLPANTEWQGEVPESGQMKGKTPFPNIIRYKGLIDLESIYRFMAHWMKDRKYEFHETLYKFKPPELDIIWVGERRKTGFIMEIIHVRVHAFGEYDLEVVQNGHKKKMSDIRMTIELNSEVQAPYANMFGDARWNAPVERKLLKFFHNYVLKRELEVMTQDVLYYEVHKFQGDIKKHLKLSMPGHVY